MMDYTISSKKGRFMKEGMTVPKTENVTSQRTVVNEAARGTKAALWWLRHYEFITHFWTGFSWVWVIGMLLLPVAGYMDLRLAIALILLIGVIANTGIYMTIRTLASYLKQLKDGPEKEEAHELMTEIIKRRIQHVG
jgi:hypothetical protein